MKTASMVSGGKTSAYMALHFPTDRYLFSPVLSRDVNCRIADHSLRQYCQAKISWFDWDRWGCREVDLTLANLRKLEQKLGTEIEWVAAPFTYDDLINQSIGDLALAFGQNTSVSPMLPNKRLRFCTEALKIYPAAWHLYLTGDGDPTLVNIGYRWDEQKRVDNWRCDTTKMALHCDIEGRHKGKHRWNQLEYRVVNFPLYQNRIDRLDVLKYWHERGWKFPEISNCDYCFFHLNSEHRRQYEEHPARSHWWVQQEEKVGATFDDRPLHQQIHGVPIEESGPLFSCLCTD